MAATPDGGKTWKAVERPLPFRSGVAWAKALVVTAAHQLEREEGIELTAGGRRGEDLAFLNTVPSSRRGDSVKLNAQQLLMTCEALAA